MKLRWLSLVVVCSLMGSVGTAQDKAGSSDKDKIQGTWSAVAGQHNGKAVPSDQVKGVQVVFTGDKLILKSSGKEMELTFKLDPSKKPKEIDVDFGGKTGTGIYELDGDNLKIAHGELGDPRPKEFVSKEGSGVSLMVFKRQKSTK
jgi:uncharacterized protein (TIGR03067 family)